MITKEEIIKELHNNKVYDIQLDVNGVCNAKCWYCPVRYEPQAKRQNLSVENLRILLDKLVDERGGILTPHQHNIYTASFNEVVLYPYFEDLLIELEKRGFRSMLMTNGVGLTKNISDIIIKHSSAVSGIHFNIPAFEKELWSKQTGFNESLHMGLIDNIQYVVDNVQSKLRDNRVSLVVNGYNEKSLKENGGYYENLENFPDIESNVSIKQARMFLERFPSIKIIENTSLNDRDSLLEKNEVVSFSKRVKEIKGY